MADSSSLSASVGGGTPTICVAFVTYIVVLKLFRKLHLHVVLLRKSNFFKVKAFQLLQDVVYFRPFADVSSVLALDLKGTEEDAALLQKRQLGYNRLKARLEPMGSYHAKAENVVDCRLKRVKVLFPLLKQLEVGYPNRATALPEGGVFVEIDDGTRKSKHESDCNLVQFNLSSDAIRIFRTSWYDQLHEEANARFMASPVRAATVTLNPEMETNMQLLQELTGLSRFRYALSGSEAVDAALKDVRMSTGKKCIVRFKSAYHGHTSGVDSMSALGENHDFIYMTEMDIEGTTAFLDKYHYLVAGVIVNPMMHFTGPNKLSPPGEKLTFGKRDRFNMPYMKDPEVVREKYARWLHALQQKCQYCTKHLTPIAFILDDIYFALRTPELISKNYFCLEDPTTKSMVPLDPDVVVLGKGIAGGAVPVSVCCYKPDFALKYDRDYLMKINKVVGTMTGYTLGLVHSNCFLEKLLHEGSGVLMNDLRERNRRFSQFSEDLSAKFEQHGVPIRVRNFANTFTVDYLHNSLYNSLFVQYLIAEGVFMSNQSTGKFNLMAEFADSDREHLKGLENAFLRAGVQMQQDGFLEDRKMPMKTMVSVGFKFVHSYLRICYDRIMKGHGAELDQPTNKCGFFWSSVFMLVVACPLAGYYRRYNEGFLVVILTHLLRQTGFFHETSSGAKKKSVFLVVLSVLIWFNLEQTFTVFNFLLGRSGLFRWWYNNLFLPLFCDVLGCWGGESGAWVTAQRSNDHFQYFHLTGEQFVILFALTTSFTPVL